MGGSCGVYSNEIIIIAPTVSSGVSEIELTPTGDAGISWAIEGVAKNGFKVVWSMTPGPTYPNRSTDKYQHPDSSTRTATLNAFDKTGTYYVRVCEYLGSSCGVYSNEISLTLTKTEE